jgi:hypothetical protein
MKITWVKFTSKEGGGQQQGEIGGNGTNFRQGKGSGAKCSLDQNMHTSSGISTTKTDKCRIS